MAAVFLAAAVQFAEARKPKSRRFHSASACGADPLHRPRDASQTIFCNRQRDFACGLIEGGFITNKDELSKLVSEDYRDQLLAAVADGILRYRDVVSQRKSALATTGQKSAEEARGFVVE